MTCAHPCSMLPPEIVSSTSYITYLVFYRQILADALLKDLIDVQSTGKFITWSTLEMVNSLCP